MTLGRFRGWILFDDSCGLCRRWVRFWAGTLERHGFAIAPLQTSWVKAQFRENTGTLLDDIRLLLPTGRLLSGADVYRYTMRQIWWAYPAFALSMTPPFHALFDKVYWWVARHRHQVSSACRVPTASDRPPQP